MLQIAMNSDLKTIAIYMYSSDCFRFVSVVCSATSGSWLEDGEELRKLRGVNQMDCARSCVRQQGCKAINYDTGKLKQ